MNFGEDANLQVLLISSITLAATLLLPRAKRWWVRPWLKRKDKGNLNLIKNELTEDPECFRNFLSMNEETFEDLLTRIKPDIEKEDTFFRSCVPARDKLIVTLRYLATGESMRSLSYSFRLGYSTVSEMIPEVCNAIYKNLKGQILKVPDSTGEWLNIADDFERKWNFPNALGAMGAMDGKHIMFNAPYSKGSTYYNYKGTHSIVLLGLVDANYSYN